MNFVSFVIVFFIVTDNAFCLRDVRLMFPKSVPNGGVANLFCLYDLEKEPLYSVKWYRGNHEIYRYLPQEIPRIRVFPLPGLNVDIDSSNSHRLTLIDVPKYLGGNFTCEISADEPNYTTGYVTKFLTITSQNVSMYRKEILNENYIKLNSTTELHNLSVSINNLYQINNLFISLLFVFIKNIINIFK